MSRYDIAIIGAGPGGYVAAIRAAQLGFKTAVIDNWLSGDGKPALGGTCLNVGCIPSKVLLDSSHHYSFLQEEAAHHGISYQGLKIDVATMIARKERIVGHLTGGIAALFAKHKIDWIKGTGRLADSKKIDVLDPSGQASSTSISADHIIIATGSKPRTLDAAPVDGRQIVDSTGALEFSDVPKRLVILGGGVIALELGSVWRRLGSEVTLLIRGNQLFPKLEESLVAEATRQLTGQGLNFALNTTVTGVKTGKSAATVTYRQGDTETQLKADKVLVCVGRVPNTSGLNAAGIGLSLDPAGFIVVDEYCQTSLAGIYAIGDVVRGPMLAHKASEEGVAVVERIAGQGSKINHHTIPWVIYTHPEIAWVGYTSQELTAAGVPFRAGTFPFKASGRAHVLGSTAGLVKILADARTDRVLGAHIMGPNASEMIAEAVLAMEFDASSEDLARTVHAHPTLSEAFHEAALAVDKRTIHI